MSASQSTKSEYVPPHLRAKFAAKNKDKPQENGLSNDDKKTLDRIIDGLSGLTPHLEALAKASNNKRDSMFDNAEFAGHVKDLIEITQGTTLADDDSELALEVVLPSEPSLQSDSKIEESKEWRPYALTQMPVFDGKSTIPAGITDIKFTEEQLLTLLGGDEYSSGTYFNSNLDRSFLAGGTYYLIDSHLDPYVPTEPDSNGAKLIAFFPEEDDDDDDDDEAPQPDFNNAPLFISVEPNQYIYMGHYSQTRYSDSLDHDTMSRHVPMHIKEYWAEQLARLDRPEWVTEKLVKRLWPYEEYKITAPGTETTEDTNVSEEEIEKFRYWFRGYTWHLSEKYTKANFLKKEDILNLFEAADCDEVPGLRLQWEYLQCVEFDPGRFFATLTMGKDMLSAQQ